MSIDTLLKYEKTLCTTWSKYMYSTLDENVPEDHILLIISKIPENIQHEIFSELGSGTESRVQISQVKPYKRRSDSEIHLGSISVICAGNTSLGKILVNSGILQRSPMII